MEKMTIAIIGGTGNEGKGLAYRWSKAGHSVIIGSRNKDKADNAVKEIMEFANETSLNCIGEMNKTAAEKADVVVLTVPYKFHSSMINELKDQLTGKLFIDVTVPLNPPKVTKVHMPEAGSALKEAKDILGEETKVACAYQNISHALLLSDDEIACDVLVCGDDKETRGKVIELVKDSGLFAIDAGPVENAVVVEGFTSILININKQYKSHTAGIRITNIDRE